MFCAILTETEGNVPVVMPTVNGRVELLPFVFALRGDGQYRTTYVTFRGVGWGRSPKVALRLANDALQKHRVDLAEKYPYGGTPVLHTKTIKKNGKKILDDFS